VLKQLEHPNIIKRDQKLHTEQYSAVLTSTMCGYLILNHALNMPPYEPPNEMTLLLDKPGMDFLMPHWH